MNSAPVKVLLIENNPSDAKRVKEALGEAGASRFDLALENTLAAGLSHLRENPPDLVLLDLTLPDSSGPATLERVRAQDGQLPIIALVGPWSDVEALRAETEAAHDWITKGELNGALLAHSIRHAIEGNRVEQMLRERIRWYREVFDGVQDAIFVETRQGHILDANRSACETYGYTHEQFLTKTVADLVPSEEYIVAVEPRDLSPLPIAPVETVNVRATGERFPLEISVRQRTLEGKTTLCVVARDITERKRAEERYQAVMEGSLAGVFIVQDDKFRYVNPAFAGFLGYSVEGIVDQLGPTDVTHPDDRQLVANEIRRCIEGELDSIRCTLRAMRRDRSTGFCEILARRWKVSGRPAILGTLIDTTDRKRAEEELTKVNRALRTLSEANRALVRARSEKTLLQEVCRIIVDTGGYRMAWVAVAGQDEQKTVRPVAMAGLEQGYLETLNLSWANNDRGQGPVGTAIRTGKPVIVQDIRTDPSFSLWREEAVRRGYFASIALPLPLEDSRPFGSLSIYGGQANAFEPEEVKLLSELADNLSYGIEALHAQDAHLKDQEKLGVQLVHLESLRTIETAIASSLDLGTTLRVFLDQVTSQLKVDAADILLFNPTSQMLEYAGGRGFHTGVLRHTHLRLGEGHAGQAALNRSPIRIPVLGESPFGPDRAHLLPTEGFSAYYAMPLVAKGTIKGVLEIFHRSPLDPDREWEGFLETLASEAALAIDNAGLFRDLQRSNMDLTLAYDATIEGWSHAMDLRDKETEGHTQRVTEMTERLASALGITGDNLLHIRRGALLHDIGKMGVPDAILFKTAPLTEEEWVIMRRHPTFAYEMLLPIEYLRPALEIPYCHHEKWDGTGYPRGLRGDQIPLSARAFAVVDVWDALRSDRPYRPSWPKEKVLLHIQAQAGKHFEPHIVDAFLKVLKVGR